MKKPDNIEANLNACICPNCPLFSHCNSERNEKFFCGNHKSSCTMDQSKMCICGACSVFEKYGLSGGYFCISGIND